ncbi:fimbria/pilus periplasmic chaperone [Luteibacter jiangsuensis]|uniref:Fimbria/pilus periplasmic chaperone n=1 Tax=Luteibacter jiangsuensis TaxID=637577 RepID=A0ABX0Q198_9GAMM|nr:fimbria/pilus periplasmic chaperone [Luteibacter jiangsuensis]NID04301.1 fimbria/pilus periplasmic chaperone [Luteibacter jiangsuensis]
MLRLVLAILACLLLAEAVRGAVVIGGTRVVFPGQARDVSLKVENKGAEPALVQVWIDDGDETSSPATAHAPFAITPPAFRIDPGQAHTLRIVHVGEAAPKEKEALYWLNVLEIPPKPTTTQGANVLQFAFRHRLKLFHRPEAMPPPTVRTTAALRWKLERDGDTEVLKVENPSPYHVSFNSVALVPDKGASATATLRGGMVAPGATMRFPLPATARGAQGGKVDFVTINDFGAPIPGSTALER